MGGGRLPPAARRQPRALDAYQAHDRIAAGPIDDHLHRLAVAWIAHTATGRSVAITAATNDHVDAVNAAIQAARRRIGHLDADHAIAIGGGEHACPGDVVATRRNDRNLRTSTGEPISNRDLWDVVSTQPDGSLTVSHRTGPSIATLPTEYAHQHVRLGYAATEHGVQGDTVDVAIELVSTATTRRGLYVGVTRGRDENRIHVVTETHDRGEARDVLDAVVAHDRADIPAVTQRRDLARHAQPVHPEPSSNIPDWVGPWRVQLEQRRDDLVGYLADRADRRAHAGAELADLQPALAAARAAWRPYAEAIAEIEDELRSRLRPAMWKANREAMHARFSHRHTTARRAEAANHRVADAEDRVAAVHADAFDVNHRREALEAQAWNLHDLAHPSAAGVGLEDLHRERVDDIDRLLRAVDVWTAWAEGRPVAITDLVESAEILTDAAGRAPMFAADGGEIERSHWTALLEPLLDLVNHRGFALSMDTSNLVPAGPDIDLDF